MKKMMWIISFIALVATAVMIPLMPERIPMHYDMAGNIDGWGSRYESLLFPAIIIALSLFWTLLMKYYEKKAKEAADEKEQAGAGTNAKVLGIAGMSMAAMFTVMQGFLLYGSYREAVSGAQKQAVDISRVSVILMGVVFLVLGNFMTKTRLNSTIGVRVKWSMYNDNTWRRANHFGAVALMVAGVLTIVTTALVKSAAGAVMAALGYLTLATILTVFHAHKVYEQEIEAEKKAG